MIAVSNMTAESFEKIFNITPMYTTTVYLLSYMKI